MKYATVDSPSCCHGQGSRVRPMRVCRDYATAHKLASAWTRGYQKAMRPHGGSGGFYRVIEVDDSTTIKNIVWLGHELDLIPTATGK